jgi:hypothetical protein
MAACGWTATGCSSIRRMPDIPGIGSEAKNALYAVMKPLLAAG